MTRSSIAKQFALVGLFCVAVMSFAFCAGPAQAQVVQPQYVRPSNGASIDVRALITAPLYTAQKDPIWHSAAGVDYDLFSPVFDFSTFQTAIISFKSSNNCNNFPMVSVIGSPTATFGATSLDYPIAAVNAGYIYQNTDIVYYVVSPISSFIKFRVQASDRAGIGPALGNNCAIQSFTVLPIPFISPKTVSATGRNNVVAVTATASPMVDLSTNGAPFSRQNLFIQNQSTSTVYCAPYSKMDATNYGFSLAPGTAKADGKGGSKDIRDWAGLFYCAVAAGAACLPNDCLVSSFYY